ncbi:MAG: hypothetical protein AB1696_28390 [Planctomycetota bacterium]
MNLYAGYFVPNAADPMGTWPQPIVDQWNNITNMWNNRPTSGDRSQWKSFWENYRAAWRGYRRTWRDYLGMHGPRIIIFLYYGNSRLVGRGGGAPGRSESVRQYIVGSRSHLQVGRMESFSTNWL